jgi:hypothetical protein
VLLLTLSQAKVIQLVASLDLEHGQQKRMSAPEATHLHYVGSAYLTDAFVNGNAVRAICGRWFVPTQDENAELPVCPRCDEDKPIAEYVLDLIRRST